MQPDFVTTQDTTPVNLSQENISRCPHDRENPYAQISRELLRNNNLSFRARGLLCYMLSFPNNWSAHPQFIAKQNGIGKDQMYAILKELIDAGYCIYIQNKEGNRFSSGKYLFSESPKFKKSLPHPGFPDAQTSNAENPDLKKKVLHKKTVAKIVVGGEPPKDVSEKMITKDDVYYYSLAARTDWKPAEIESAWLAYDGAKAPISDPYAYIAGIISKKRALSPKTKEKQCKMTTKTKYALSSPPSPNSKGAYSNLDMSAPSLAKFGCL